MDNRPVTRKTVELHDIPKQHREILEDASNNFEWTRSINRYLMREYMCILSRIPRASDELRSMRSAMKYIKGKNIETVVTH